MPKELGPITAQIEAFVRMEARGESRPAILEKIFGLGPDASDRDKNAADQKMYRWRHRPDIQPIWDDEVRSFVRQCIPSAMSRIRQQVNDDNGWLANKAANDVIGLAKTTSIFQQEDKAVSVRIEGMPDIGTPDQDEE